MLVSPHGKLMFRKEALEPQVAEAKANGLPGKQAEQVSGILPRHANVFQMALRMDSMERAEPMTANFTSGAQLVKGRSRQYISTKNAWLDVRMDFLAAFSVVSKSYYKDNRHHWLSYSQLRLILVDK